MRARREEGGWRGPLGATLCELADTSPEGTPYLNWAVIGATVLASLWFMPAMYGSMARPGALVELVRRLGSIPCQADLSCLGGALLSMMAHAGLVHLIGNMLFLYKVGDNVELTLGRPAYLLVYLASGLAGALVQAVVSLGIRGASAPLFQVGSSAAISGLIGSYIVTYPGASMCYCLCLSAACYCTRVKASTYFALWVVFQLVLAAANPYIGVYAHLAGLLVGAALTPLLARPARIERLRRQLALGRYRGLMLDKAELLVPSANLLAKLVLATAAVALAAFTAAAALHLSNIDGMYYQVVEGETPGLYDLMMQPEPPPRAASLCGHACGYYAVISPEPLRPRHGRVLYTVRLDRVYEAGLASLALVAAASLGAFWALAQYRRLEVTYIPPEMEDLRRRLQEHHRPPGYY
jgi:membrane associated rhomboid family serine protease